MRSATLPFRRTEVKSQFQALRERLPEEEQTLLVLRVDKKLTFQEIAMVLLGEETPDEALKRESARLRKRFQLVKEKLKKWAQEEGILRSS